MGETFYSLVWRDQADRSVAADFLEHAAQSGSRVIRDKQGVWWLARVRPEMAVEYGVKLTAGHPQGVLEPAVEFHAPGHVEGSGERVCLNTRESDVYSAIAFVLDRVEGAAFAQAAAPDETTVLLDSPYAGGSMARARNFAVQFGVTVTLNDDPRWKPRWDLRRPRLGVTRETIAAAPEVVRVLERYHVPWTSVEVPQRPQFDMVIVGRSGAAEPFRRGGGHVISAEGRPLTIDGLYPLTPANAKRLLHTIYLGSAREV